MPQLIPFHFVNEFTVTILGLGLLLVLVSYYFLRATLINNLLIKFFTFLYNLNFIFLAKILKLIKQKNVLV